MKKFTKYILNIFMFVIIAATAIVSFSGNFFVGNLNASEAKAEDIKDANINYDRLEKEIYISEDKKLNITERTTITYKFGGINRGFERCVSRANTTTRIVNNKKYKTTTYHELELLSVKIKGENDTDFTKEWSGLERDNEYYYILVGNDIKDAGTYEYEIKYTYNLGHDFINDFDDFTFDLLDYGFYSKVDSFKATIHFPKSIEGADISFRTNGMASLSNSAVNCELDQDNLTLTCELNMSMPKKNGLTVQVILSEGYFMTSFTPNAVYYLLLGSIILALLAMVIILSLNIVDKKCVVVPTFTPPYGLSPLVIAKAYRGKAKPKDLSALMIHWASLGLISLENENKYDLVITKLKEYPQIQKNDKYYWQKKRERDYFNALFKNGDEYSTKKNRYSYNSTLSSATSVLLDEGLEKTKKRRVLRSILHVFAMLPLVFAIIWAMTFTPVAGVMFFMLLFPTIAIFVFIYTPMPILFKLIWCGGFGGVPLGFLVGFASSGSTYDIYHLVVISAVVFVVVHLSTMFIKVYTRQEKELRGQVLGFKKFLVNARLDELEQMISENPNYYYDILPYCYVFNITNKMESRFSALNMENPSYCMGMSAGVYFSMMTHASHHITRSMSGGSSGFGRGSGGGSHGSSGGGGGGGGSRGR